MTSDPSSSDFLYKKYSLEHLENWLHDAIDCEDLTPQEIYDTITNVVDENIEYHKKCLTKNIEVLSLLKGHRDVDFGVGNNESYDGWDYTEIPESSPRVCDKNDPSPECKKDWSSFWEDDQYTEKEMDAMCDAAEDKEKCREYNLREAEYYDKRAKLDAEYNRMIEEGYTLTDDGFWIKES